MTIQEQIQKDMIEAMKAKETLKLEVLRGMKTAIKNKEIEKIRALSETEALQVLDTLVKQRKDSIEQFNKGGRVDLVEREQAELRILESYLPAALGDEEVKSSVAQVIFELQANSAKDVGRVMKAAMAKFAGQRVDGKLVSDLVRAALQAGGKQAG